MIGGACERDTTRTATVRSGAYSRICAMPSAMSLRFGLAIPPANKRETHGTAPVRLRARQDWA